MTTLLGRPYRTFLDGATMWLYLSGLSSTRFARKLAKYIRKIALS